jgi:hypothetical protein
MKDDTLTATRDIYSENPNDFFREKLVSGAILKFEIPFERFQSSIQKISEITEEHGRKQILSFRIIRNLFKKVNYLNKVQLLQNNELSEDEFRLEIENNPQKYVIDVNENLEGNDHIIISNLIKEFYEQTEDYTESDWGEMFSINSESFKFIAANFYHNRLNWQSTPKNLNQ